MTQIVKILKIHPNAKLPSRAHNSDQCWDFFVPDNDKPYPTKIVIDSGETKRIKLGIRMILPTGYGLEFKEKSGLASKSLIIGGGIIDEQFRGELEVIIHNFSQYAHFIMPGDKIVQGELVKRIDAEIVEIAQDEFDINTERKEGGFGSSGR